MGTPREPQITPAYQWYVLGLLTVIYVFNLIDRSIVSILQEPIRQELGLTDSQLGALTGLAFALFYATLAVPIARFADRGRRTLVIALSIGLFSLMTGLCGVASGFTALLIFRIGVGVGEAGGVPPAVSVISDYFPANKRGTAMAIYGFGPPVGLMLGVFAGGWLNEYLGWRSAFYFVGAAGFVLAPVAYLTLRELPRGFSDRVAGRPPEPADVPTLIQVIRTIWGLRSFRHLAIGGAAHAYAIYSMINWNPPFYIRVHELGTAEVGTFIGLLAGIAGGLGTVLGGTIADRLGTRDTRWYMWLPGVAMLLSVPAALAQYLVADAYVSFAIAGASYFLLSVYIGPFIATAQSLVVASMRATTQAVILMVFNIFGLSLGPFFTGMLSDALNFQAGLGADSLRYALCLAVLFNLWAAFHFIRGAVFLRADMERDRSRDGG